MKAFMQMFAVFLIAIFSTVIAFAQEVIIPEVPTTDFFLHLVQSLGGIKGAGTLVIVSIVVQILIRFLGTPLFGELFKKVNGAAKITIYLALSLIAGVTSLMAVSGLSIGSALIHSSTMAAFGVLFNQIYKQYFEKKD